MKGLRVSSKLIVIIIVVLGVFLASSAQAWVTYKFAVTSEPTATYHLPFKAEIQLRDSAVDAGQATSNDIISLQIKGGSYVPQSDPIIFTDLHANFINIAVTLSSDRSTITSFYAQNSLNMEQYDYWIFHQQNPNAPGQNIHDNVAKISADTVRLDTLLLPDYTYAISQFTGQWKRERFKFDCWICDIFKQYVAACFPWCPWPWLLLGIIFTITMAVWYMKKNKQR